MINHLDVLGLSRLPSSAEELQSAYRSKARSTHPDNGGSSEKFVAVRAAYDTLRDPVKLQSWAAEYRAHCQRQGLTVCSKCLTASRSQARNCGCAPSERTRADQVRDALADELTDFVVRVSSRVGDRVADLAVDLVDQGVNKIKNRVTKRRG